MFWDCYLCNGLAVERTALAADVLADTYLVNWFYIIHCSPAAITYVIFIPLLLFKALDGHY